MFIELVELFRCVRPHEESWLVASIDEMRDRSIQLGKLGCPICSAEYPIVGGVAIFSGEGDQRGANAPGKEDAEETALRAGAFLGLAHGGGVALLGGSWSTGAEMLATMAEVRVIAANGRGAISDSAAVGRVHINDSIPLGTGSCAGVALDASFGDLTFAAAQRVVRPGGRIVGPRSITMPSALSLLAEDDAWWVAEKPPEVTTLRRGSR